MSHQIEIEAEKQARVHQSMVGAGVATGVGVAAAALAWLGGGAIAAGGSGMVGGQALLAMAGPIGWAIGGVAIAGGAFWASSQNEKAARDATKYAVQVEAEIGKLKAADTEVTNLTLLTRKHAEGVRSQLVLANLITPCNEATSRNAC